MRLRAGRSELHCPGCGFQSEAPTRPISWLVCFCFLCFLLLCCERESARLVVKLCAVCCVQEVARAAGARVCMHVCMRLMAAFLVLLVTPPVVISVLASVGGYMREIADFARSC